MLKLLVVKIFRKDRFKNALQNYIEKKIGIKIKNLKLNEQTFS